MKDLRHQHICQLYQVIETDEYYFLVLEVFFLIYFVCCMNRYSIFVMVNYLIIL
jgi:hypothetical protein